MREREREREREGEKSNVKMRQGTTIRLLSSIKRILNLVILSIISYPTPAIRRVVVNGPRVSFNKVEGRICRVRRDAGSGSWLGSLLSADNACLPVVMSLENPVFAGKRRDN
jgi:hypothetical protein